jgi:REP element-mobilizing transposase RayT
MHNIIGSTHPGSAEPNLGTRSPSSAIKNEWRSRGYLPHLDRIGLLQSITFRLADSLPQEKLRELEMALKKENNAEPGLRVPGWKDAEPGLRVPGWKDAELGLRVPGWKDAELGLRVPGWKDAEPGLRVPGWKDTELGFRVPGWKDAEPGLRVPGGCAPGVKRRKQIEAWLDAGLGCCALRHPQMAAVMQDTLLKFDEQKYLLLAWCIMPNHVHVLIEPKASLSTIVRSWKSYTGRWAMEHGAELGLHAPRFWMPDYWDRFIRDVKHLRSVIDYIHNNPGKAGLCQKETDWPLSIAYVL